MLETILFALWFFLPAGAANMIPVPISKVSKLKDMNAPLDFGMKYRGQRVFGEHKTWRGLLAGIVAATFVVWLQQVIVRHFDWFSGVDVANDYTDMPTIMLGLVLAVGALGGDAVKSFFKRQLHIKPGAVWLPYDLIDHIVGAAILALPFVVFEWWIYPAVVLVWIGANIGVSYIGYLIGIKERPF